MSMNCMNKAYLVSDAYLLTMQEKPDGVDYHCFDNKEQMKIAEGHLGWDVLDAVPMSTLDVAHERRLWMKSVCLRIRWLLFLWRCWSGCRAAERFWVR